MITRKALPRRTFLKGVGTAIALPFLDAMTPAMAASAAPNKVRMAFVYVPNGIMMSNWNPDYEGKLTELPRTLKSMEPFKDDILLTGNLTHNTGRALLDGAGDHGRCCGSYLTGVQVKKSTSDIHASVSMDQLVAKEVGGQTRFPSLELGLEDARQSGDCDSGYSCAYTNNLAWRSETQPLPPILDPRALFERLFGNGVVLSPEARERQALYRRSILDFVTGDTKKLEAGLGPTDRRKLDEYLSSIREVETQIERAEKDNQHIDPHMEKPYGVPADFAEHFKLMTDMMTIAFQADLTRVVTFLVTHEGTSRAYREIDISDGHHPLTHHRNQPELMEKVSRINEYQMKQFALWIGKMKQIKEGDRSLLDNCMIVYGAGLSDGNRHLHEDLPTMIVGRGGNYIKTGRRVVYRKETPMCNLFLTMMDRMGVHMEHFGDATGKLEGLDVT
jgi:Protein of unknown function (DUF1552)